MNADDRQVLQNEIGPLRERPDKLQAQVQELEGLLTYECTICEVRQVRRGEAKTVPVTTLQWPGRITMQKPVCPACVQKLGVAPINLEDRV